MEPPESNAIVTSKQSNRNNNKENESSGPGSQLQIKKKQVSTKSHDKRGQSVISLETPYKNVAHDPGSRDAENEYADERFDEVLEMSHDVSPGYHKPGKSPPAALSQLKSSGQNSGIIKSINKKMLHLNE